MTDKIIQDIENIIELESKQIDIYLMKKRRKLLHNIFNAFGANIGQRIIYPYIIYIEEIDTEENNEILQHLRKNNTIRKLFASRSLHSKDNSNEKNSLRNVMRQMIQECNLIAERSTIQYTDMYGNDKTKTSYKIREK